MVDYFECQFESEFGGMLHVYLLSIFLNIHLHPRYFHFVYSESLEKDVDETFLISYFLSTEPKLGSKAGFVKFDVRGLQDYLIEIYMIFQLRTDCLTYIARLRKKVLSF